MTRLALVLLAVLVACSVSLVASRHQSRKLFVELEQSTWSMPARVEKVAREQLRMLVPPAGRVEVVEIPGLGGPR